MSSRGIAFVLVMAFILAVVVSATISLLLMSTQARLTHHQVSRIQAFYAAQAGINYALEQLRTGGWVAGTDCPSASPCSVSFDSGDFKPPSIVGNTVSVVIRSSNSPPDCPGDEACVSATAAYTY